MLLSNAKTFTKCGYSENFNIYLIIFGFYMKTLEILLRCNLLIYKLIYWLRTVNYYMGSFSPKLSGIYRPMNQAQGGSRVPCSDVC